MYYSAAGNCRESKMKQEKFEDRRPFMRQENGMMVAHGEPDKNGRDARWPLGSAMNPIPPGESRSSPLMEKFARK